MNGVSVCSTRMLTCSQMNFRPRLRSIAPGSRPDFEQDLEAVADAEHRTAGVGERLAPTVITGENRAIAPVRR